MRAVWSWLSELVAFDRDVTVHEAAAALTGAGLEVEAVERTGAGFSGVVVAQVVGKRPHPDADRLTLVDVIDAPGGGVTEVVCGAGNVPDPGGMVLWARPGAVLPGGRAIGKREIKGVMSAGMLCSEDELGLGVVSAGAGAADADDAGDDAGDGADAGHGAGGAGGQGAAAHDDDGIVVLSADDALGTGDLLGAPDALARLGLGEWVLDVSVPANRPDALGHLGLARELAALLGGTVRLPDSGADTGAGTGADARADGGAGGDSADATETVEAADLRTADLVAVDIEDPGGCPRYAARVIDGVSVRPSPMWMRQRLRAVGVRPISNLVDISNYVMFELGQPLHAFDAARVRGARIVVRRARAGERMVTLDKVDRALEPDDVLICDGEGPVALAGVMGGLDSEVTAGTTRVLLETASFDPAPVRQTARRLGLHSEASHRFERGVDPNIVPVAAARAAQLMAKLGGGRVAAGMVDNYARPIEPAKVAIRASRTSLVTGVTFDRQTVIDTLARLGLPAEPAPSHDGDDDTATVTCPTYRPDLEREVDLIEEVIRVYGVDRVPATLPRTSVSPAGNAYAVQTLVRRALTAAGLSEAITYGFTSRARIAALRLPDDDPRTRPVPLRNPMTEDNAVMRTSLVPNLLAAVARNASYGIGDVALFEIGSVFFPRGEGQLPEEPVHVAGVMAGRRPGWLSPGAEVSFADIRGAVEALLGALLGRVAAHVVFTPDADVPYMHPGICAAVELPQSVRLGHVGEIHPETRLACGVEVPCFGFDLALAGVQPPPPAQMQPIVKYPAITRDVSFFASADIPAARVHGLLHDVTEPLIERVTVLEDYRDPAVVPAGQKGMLWSVIYRSAEGTLTDEQVDGVHERLVARLLDELGATRR